MSFLIHRKVLISMLFLGLSMLGYFSYNRLPLELFPNAEEPIFYVNIVGVTEVSPDYMEKQAIVPLEGAIGTLAGVEEITSVANAANGNITINYNKDIDTKYAYLELLEKIEATKSQLPDEFNVSVSKSSLDMLGNLFIMLQVRGSGGVNRVRDITDKEIKTALENIDGIATAQVFGGRQKTIEIILNNDLCEAYGITPGTVRSILSQNNKSKTFVGEVIDGNNRQFVNVSAEYRDILDLQSVVVQENGPVLLGDVSDIFFGVKEETSISRVNGMDAVTIQLIRDSQVNMIDLSHKVTDAVDRLNRELSSQDTEVVVQMNLAEIMEDNIDQIVELALIGGLLAVFILWIFLRNVRLVLAVGASIPISVYTAFNFFYAAGISINSLTLVGMALAIGMLVDNSVVVLENIYRHAGLKKSKAQAVVDGTAEVRRSVFAATLTTVCVFLPFIFSTNVFVKLIGQHIGVSIISTLVVSLFVALLLIPMLSYLFMSEKRVEAFQRVSIHNKLIRLYLVVLKAAMRRPATTVISALGIFFGVILISLLLSVATTQEVETNDLNVNVTMPGGTTLDGADQTTAEIERKLGEIEEVQDISSNINEENAALQVKLKEDYQDIADRTIAEIKSDILNRTRSINATIDVSGAANFGGGGNGRSGGGNSNRGAAGFQSFLGIGDQSETILIKGQDFNQMKKVAEDMKFYLTQLSTVQNASLSIADDRPEVHLNFDQQLMSQYGITVNNVTGELSSFQPEFASGINFKHGLEEYEITIKTDEEEEEKEVSRTFEELSDLDITNPQGAVYDLDELSDIYYASGMWGINRRNQDKEIRLTYSFYQQYNESADLLETAKLEVGDMLASLTLPSGVAVEAEESIDQLAEYKMLLAVGVILIFMILASIFESMVTPFVLMFSIPLATIGSFLALMLTGNSILNPNSLTGLLILLGVVVNNSIILIDYSNVLRKQGYNRLRAMIMAGIARVRPIMITAVTTIVAMVPLAMGNMEYVAVIGAPFAITVIGGLLFSTVLTLVFIPTLNLGLENSLNWIRSLSLKVKLIQLIVFIALIFIIFENIDAAIWQSIFFMMALIGVPAGTYLALKSLKQANEEIIPRDEEIQIKIENLVKVYGRENRLQRDWKGGEIRRIKLGEVPKWKDIKDFKAIVWELPLTAFLYYFTYSYLDGGIWLFFFAIATYVYTMRMLDQLGKFRALFINNNWLRKIGKITFQGLFWTLPVVNAGYFVVAWGNYGFPSFVLVLWIFALLIRNTAVNLEGHDINPELIKNRFKRNFYRLVYKIPIIGKKREPFKALKGVSLEINKGMFGLLGPNGAGKTTLMRIICGIFEQSYGKIWFNEFDTQEKREELQGLIGYLPQEFGMYENMSPHEYLHYQAILKGIVDKNVREDRVKMVLDSVNMFDKRFDKIGSFSGGMKQRIGIAQILLHLPRILVVDEPTAGLDPRERIRFRNLLVELSKERIVIFSTHIIEDIASSCRNVAVLNKGDLMYKGSPADMTNVAEGKVWQYYIDKSEFEEAIHKMKIIHHMTEGNRIKVRCLSEKAPTPDAIKVTPNLEDSYLWLMRDSGQVLSKLEG